MTPDEPLRADLAALTVSLARRLARLEADLETTRRLALDLAGSQSAEQHDCPRAAGQRFS